MVAWGSATAVVSAFWSLVILLSMFWKLVMSKPSNLLTVSSNLHLSLSSFIHCDGEIHPHVDDTQQEEQEEGKHQHKRLQKHLGVRELELELEVLNMAFSEDSLVCDFDDWPAGGCRG